MSEHERDELLATLGELARRYPHWRVGQLVANVAGWSGAEVWDAEDGSMLAAARAHLSVAPAPANVSRVEAEPEAASNPTA